MMRPRVRQEVAAHANHTSAAFIPLFLSLRLIALSFAESSLKAAHSADARSARWEKCADGCAAAAAETVSYIDTDAERNVLGSVLRPLIRPPLVSLPSFPHAFSIPTFQQFSDVA